MVLRPCVVPPPYSIAERATVQCVWFCTDIDLSSAKKRNEIREKMLQCNRWKMGCCCEQAVVSLEPLVQLKNVLGARASN